MGFFDSSPDSGNNDPSQSFWGDPGNQAAFGALAGILQAGTTPRFAPNGWGIKGGGALNALAALSGAGMAGAVNGAGNAQKYQSEALANQNTAVMNPIAQQTAQLGLERQQALQPMQLSMMKNAMQGAQGSQSSAPFGMPQSGGSGLSGGMDAADQQFAQAYQLAMASGDMGKAAVVMQSWAEHNPQLAGAVKNAQEQNTYQKTPQGTYVMPNGAGSSFGSMAPQQSSASMPVQSAPVTPMVNNPNQAALDAYRQQNGMTAPPIDAQRAAAGLPVGVGSNLPIGAPMNTGIPSGSAQPIPPINASQLQPTQSATQKYTPMDGKPILQGVSENAPPSPFGQPHFTTPNTTNGIEDHNKLRDTALAQNTELSATGQQTAQMLARLHDMASAAQSGQMGGLIAQDPELMQKAVAAGLIKDGKMTNDLSQIQRFQSDQMMEVINQLKMTNAGPGGGKLMRAEVQGAAEKMADPTQQPQAIHDILAIGAGLGNYNQDMLKAWQAKGGLGNSLNNGDSMLAGDFQAKWSTNHDIDDYIAQAKKDMPPFKGMPQVGNSAPQIKNWVRVNGKLVQQ